MEEPVSTLVHVPGNLRRPACGDNSGSWPLPILWRMGLVKPGLRYIYIYIFVMDILKIKMDVLIYKNLNSSII